MGPVFGSNFFNFDLGPEIMSDKDIQKIHYSMRDFSNPSITGEPSITPDNWPPIRPDKWSPIRPLSPEFGCATNSYKDTLSKNRGKSAHGTPIRPLDPQIMWPYRGLPL